MAKNFKVETVHKRMYPATHNFKLEADSTSGTDIEFVDGATTGANTTAKIISDIGSHKKVLEIYDNDGGAFVLVKDDFGAGAQTSGIVELWLRVSDATPHSFVKLWQGGSLKLYFAVRIENLYYHTGAAWNAICAISDNTWYHMRIDFDCATDTFDFYVDGVLEENGTAFYAVGDNITTLEFSTSTGDNGYYAYIDAIGYSWDTDYKIGDNCFWRHYAESTDSFEGDDVGTQGTSITWVDGVNTAADHEIVAEYNEHKKILKTIRTAGTGVCYHTLASQSTAGWVAGWFKVSDANAINGIIQLAEVANLRIKVQIDNDRFEYDAGAGMVVVGLAAVDATWYFLYLQWYADNTFDLWINNVQYLDGVSTFANFTGAGINNWYINIASASPATIYLDAPTSSLDSDSRGDNRLFDYNATYTKTDITTDVINVFTNNKLHKWRTGSLLSIKDYENTEVFFLIYDINSKLSMEAELGNRVQNKSTRTYILLDKNLDDLNNPSSNTFSASKIHDPTNSTCILKTILPNVSEADGDLILVNADTKTDTYSPVTKHYPDYMMLQDISDIADSVVIVEANGKCHLDDDLASGTTLDLDVAANKDCMISDPKLNNILDTINYFEVFGDINPDTGARFYKITDNSGTDRKRKWRYTNNNFRSQTDIDAYTAKLVAKLIPIKEITIYVQGLGTHNMGETLNYKFVNAVYNIPQANYYIVSESMDYDTGASVIKLSEGLIESSKYASRFEKVQNYSDAYAAQIYETDLITVDLSLYPYGALANWDDYGIKITDNVNGASCHLFLDEKIDDSRNIEFSVTCKNGSNGALTFDGLFYVYERTNDGGIGFDAHINGVDMDFIFTADNGYKTEEATLLAADVNAGTLLQIVWLSDEDMKDVIVNSMQARIYVKRSV